MVTMYIRTTAVKRKHGTLKYVQLCHNVWDPKAGKSKTQVLYSFGRADQLDADALRRLIKSMSRYLEPADIEAIQEHLGEE